MAGTIEGGKKAAATNKQRYGKTFYSVIGAEGGRKSTGGGFAKDRDLARKMGKRGGMASRNRTVAERAKGCPNGHAWTIDSTGYHSITRFRFCKVCARQKAHASYLKKMEEKANADNS